MRPRISIKVCVRPSVGVGNEREHIFRPDLHNVDLQYMTSPLQNPFLEIETNGRLLLGFQIPCIKQMSLALGADYKSTSILNRVILQLKYFYSASVSKLIV